MDLADLEDVPWNLSTKTTYQHPPRGGVWTLRNLLIFLKVYLGVKPKIGVVFTPQIIHLFIGFSMIFTIHFGGFTTPIFGLTPIWTVLYSTLPKTNSEFTPENCWLGDVPLLLGSGNLFRGEMAVSFREGNTRWWFQTVLFSPLPWKMIQFDYYFSHGFKPPTRTHC